MVNNFMEEVDKDKHKGGRPKKTDPVKRRERFAEWFPTVTKMRIDGYLIPEIVDELPAKFGVEISHSTIGDWVNPQNYPIPDNPDSDFFERVVSNFGKRKSGFPGKTSNPILSRIHDVSHQEPTGRIRETS